MPKVVLSKNWSRSSKVSVSKKIGRKKQAERLAKKWANKSKPKPSPEFREFIANRFEKVQ